MAMSHVFLISAVGFCLSLFPRSNPLLPAPLLKQLSRLSISIFGPALIFYSTSSALDWVLFKKAIILCLFSVSQNLLCLVIGRMFRCFHPDRRFGKVIEIAVGTPNQLSLPIMVMLSMCKSDVINADFAGPELDAAEECGRTVSTGRRAGAKRQHIARSNRNPSTRSYVPCQPFPSLAPHRLWLSSSCTPWVSTFPSGVSVTESYPASRRRTPRRLPLCSRLTR